jgi:hypothetical protein
VGCPELGQVRADAIRERRLAGACDFAALAVGQEAPFGELQALQLVQSARDLPEPELPLELAQGMLDLGAVLPALPRTARFGMHAIHHDVHMGMRPVLVGHEERLVLG